MVIMYGYKLHCLLEGSFMDTFDIKINFTILVVERQNNVWLKWILTEIWKHEDDQNDKFDTFIYENCDAFLWWYLNGINYESEIEYIFSCLKTEKCILATCPTLLPGNKYSNIFRLLVLSKHLTSMNQAKDVQSWSILVSATIVYHDIESAETAKKYLDQK